MSALLKRCKHKPDYWSDCPCPWHYNFRCHGQKQRGTLGTFETRADAKKALGDVKTRIENGLPAFEPKAETATTVPETVEIFGKSWLRDLNLKPRTVRFYTDNFENHVIPALGPIPVSGLRRSQCIEFAKTVRRKKLATATRKGIIRTLSACLAHAVDAELITHNPASKLGKYLWNADEPKSTKLTKDKFFTRDEVANLLTVAREHFPEWYPFVLCGVLTGLRLGELLGLEWGDLDWHGRFVHVQREWNDIAEAFTPTKSSKDRHVDLSTQLRTELRVWRARQSRAWLKRGLSRPKLVFPSNVGTALDPSNVRKAFGRILDKAEQRHRNVHAMRHTFASTLVQNGESLAYVQQQMGHSSIKITVDVYGHLIPGEKSHASDRLDASFGLRSPEAGTKRAQMKRTA